ncbi:hypothetical protein B0H34DRAFT_735449 [Crassisporium funariophilum]|nr:hypothetical protein B0H34DRAFT_735449 [Crassisporium funariophilum]
MQHALGSSSSGPPNQYSAPDHIQQHVQPMNVHQYSSVQRQRQCIPSHQTSSHQRPQHVGPVNLTRTTPTGLHFQSDGTYAQPYLGPPPPDVQRMVQQQALPRSLSCFTPSDQRIWAARRHGSGSIASSSVDEAYQPSPQGISSIPSGLTISSQSCPQQAQPDPQPLPSQNNSIFANHSISFDTLVFATAEKALAPMRIALDEARLLTINNLRNAMQVGYQDLSRLLSAERAENDKLRVSTAKMADELRLGKESLQSGLDDVERWKENFQRSRECATSIQNEWVRDNEEVAKYKESMKKWRDELKLEFQRGKNALKISQEEVESLTIQNLNLKEGWARAAAVINEYKEEMAKKEIEQELLEEIGALASHPRKRRRAANEDDMDHNADHRMGAVMDAVKDQVSKQMELKMNGLLGEINEQNASRIRAEEKFAKAVKHLEVFSEQSSSTPRPLRDPPQSLQKSNTRPSQRQDLKTTLRTSSSLLLSIRNMPPSSSITYTPKIRQPGSSSPTGMAASSMEQGLGRTQETPPLTKQCLNPVASLEEQSTSMASSQYRIIRVPDHDLDMGAHQEGDDGQPKTQPTGLRAPSKSSSSSASTRGTRITSPPVPAHTPLAADVVEEIITPSTIVTSRTPGPGPARSVLKRNRRDFEKEHRDDAHGDEYGMVQDDRVDDQRMRMAESLIPPIATKQEYHNDELQISELPASKQRKGGAKEEGKNIDSPQLGDINKSPRGRSSIRQLARRRDWLSTQSAQLVGPGSRPAINVSRSSEMAAVTEATVVVSKPRQLGISHHDLLYKRVGQWLACRMCLTRDRDESTSRIRTNPKGTTHQKFPANASWADLIAHCQSVHPQACRELEKLSPGQIAEMKQRMQK